MFNNLIGKNKELGRFLFCERYTLPPVKNAMYIAEGQELKRGAVVDVNGVLVGTNSLMPYAVLEFDCDTRDGGKEASVFVKGEFNFDKLHFADGLEKSDLDNIVYNGSGIGIVIKPYAFDKEFSPKSNDGGGYKEVTLPPIVSEPYNIPVGNREIVTVSYIGASDTDAIQLQLADDCVDAIVFFANKRPADIAFNKLKITRQDINDVPLFGKNYLYDVHIHRTYEYDTLISDVIDGSGVYGIPTDWSEVSINQRVRDVDITNAKATNSSDTGFLIEIKGNVAILHIH